MKSKITFTIEILFKCLGTKSTKKAVVSPGNTVTSADRVLENGSEGSGDEDGINSEEVGNPGGKPGRETERRYANNARERLV